MIHVQVIVKGMCHDERDHMDIGKEYYGDGAWYDSRGEGVS